MNKVYGMSDPNPQPSSYVLGVKAGGKPWQSPEAVPTMGRQHHSSGEHSFSCL